jgi:ABC-type Fe3+-hydroxamate transport system substrate-binding protein
MNKKTFVDQLNRRLELIEPPQRIISLVPSITEYLADLGLENEIVGITKFCIHPTTIFQTKKRVGGTKKVNFDSIATLNPDLIIANKEENTKEDIEYLSDKYNVWISDINTWQQALEMMTRLGEICGKAQKSAEIVNLLIEKKEKYQSKSKLNSFPKVLYLIWRNPYMAAGKNTFINEILELGNFENVVVEKSRYPELNSSDLKNLSPDLVFLSSEPYPFKQKHIEELKQYFPYAKILLVDGEMFSWYGSRLLKTFDYLEDF